MLNKIINKIISYLFLGLALYSAYRTITDDVNYWGIWVTIFCLVVAYREKIRAYENA